MMTGIVILSLMLFKLMKLTECNREHNKLKERGRHEESDTTRNRKITIHCKVEVSSQSMIGCITKYSPQESTDIERGCFCNYIQRFNFQDSAKDSLLCPMF